jgi:ATP-binding cassette subfamily F protein 3
MIQAQNLCLSFGNQTIFDHISFIIQTHQRIGLVGANGTGKSTLLKALTGKQLLDSGTVSISKQCKVAYMPQEMVLQSEKTVYEEALSTFQELYQALAILTELEPLILENPTENQLEAYTQAQEIIKNLNHENVKKEIIHVLSGLGFSEEQQQQPVNTLSVGWKMRVVLAKLLLQKADFYFFDEPTNHLDIVAKDWFLQFLKNSSCGFLLVCHERYFLDMLCTDILELELGKATWYKGNYSAYEHQKELSLEALEKAYEQQQREIARKMATIERFRASASKAKMAQSMLKELEKIERIELPPSPKSINFHFGSTTRTGKKVLSVENISFSFGTKKIFSNISFDIERGERVALVAPNGTGKTTLFNVVTGIYKPTAGSITLGHNVKHALFAQDQNAVLPLQKTIFEHLCAQCPQKTEQEIRSILGAFLFSNDTIHKKLGVLSGGEKNRVSMVTVLMQDANFLMLDEPTNHLDMQSKEILLKALLGFNGTIFFVSHDHDFINKLATRILELTPSGIESYEGNYNDYLYQKQFRTQHTQHHEIKSSQTTKTNSATDQLDGKQVFELRKQLKKLEQSIAKLEETIKTTELRFAELEYGTAEFQKNQTELLALRNNLEKNLNEWEYLLTQLDSL